MKKNNKKGFTLVELVIVVAVMAILVAVAIPTVKSITGTATAAVADTNAKTIESMIKLHEANVEAGKTTADKLCDDLEASKLGIEGLFEYDPDTSTVTPYDSTSEELPAATAVTKDHVVFLFADDGANVTSVKGTKAS